MIRAFPIDNLDAGIGHHPLASYMSEISEDCYCAGWMDGTEFVLYEAMEKNEATSWGQGQITKENIDTLRTLSEENGNCWIVWTKFGPLPTSINSFKEFQSPQQSV